MGIGIGFLLGAVLGFAWACIEYARSSWVTNADLMGASMAFTAIWILSSVLLAAGLFTIGALSLIVASAIGVGSVVIGKLFEWFLLESVLRGLFREYRQTPNSRMHRSGD